MGRVKTLNLDQRTVSDEGIEYNIRKLGNFTLAYQEIREKSLQRQSEKELDEAQKKKIGSFALYLKDRMRKLATVEV
jgi:hypothetical protein